MTVNKPNFRTLARSLMPDGPVFLLETQPPFKGRTFLAAHPIAVLTAVGDRIRLEQSGQEPIEWQQNAWDALHDFRASDDDWVFCALGYDLKNQDDNLESKNPDAIHLPDLIAIKPGFLMIENEDGSINVVKEAFPQLHETDPFDTLLCLESDTETRASYMEKIQSIQHDIHEGDYYELNLSHQLGGQIQGNPFDLYKYMADQGPVPMSAFVSYHDTAIVCASPERFLKRTGNSILSEPIKGTRPRFDDPFEDDRSRNDLVNSVKERAENLMIVDLVRNDLSRIALPGTVLAESLFEIRSYATVHQMVSTVSAEVDSTMPSVSILRATFPMGSMTGAPKLRVMEAIDHYESYKRSIYSGAIGYISPGGDLDFNVVIRTAIVRGNRWWYSTGGAITSDSIPEDEWIETWVKARALGVNDSLST